MMTKRTHSNSYRILHLKNLFIQKLLNHPPLNIAHRGARNHAPENTLAAFEKAIKHGADGVELDVRLCRSGEWVVFHDLRLNRTTNGRGYVRRKTLHEIRNLDAGIKFSKQYHREMIPTLAEVLEMAKDRLFLNIEIKSISLVSDHNLAQLIQLLCRARVIQKCLISSFNPLVLRRIAQFYPQISTGLILAGNCLSRHAAYHLKRITSVQSLHVHTHILSRQFVKKIRDLGTYLLAWGANTQEELMKLIELEVDGIITDEPLKLSRILRGN